MIAIKNEAIHLTLDPHVGGTITSIVHAVTGLSVLGKVPWDALGTPLTSFAARDETEWLTRYTGGWPLLFPNGGDACTHEGTFHGFHGEASISPWDVSAGRNAIALSRRFFTVPVEMHRTILLQEDEVVIDEEVTMLGAQPVEVMWGHHPTFGSDLLAGPIEITSGARRAVADEDFNPDASPLLPGGSGELAAMPGKHGLIDAAHPSAPLAALLYLDRFGTGWAAIRRLDNAIAVALSWDKGCFPCAWLWFELMGTSGAPWHGRTSLIGLEPNTTKPACGIAGAKAKGGSLLRLEPGSRRRTQLRLRVFRPEGIIRSYAP